MPRDKQPLAFGQWTHGGSETAFAPGRSRVRPDDSAGGGA